MYSSLYLVITASRLSRFASKTMMRLLGTLMRVQPPTAGVLQAFYMPIIKAHGFDAACRSATTAIHRGRMLDKEAKMRMPII
jgi:hypothetical protein